MFKFLYWTFFGIIFSTTAALAALPYQPEFSWTPPSEFTDGSPLTPATDLSKYVIYCADSAGNTMSIDVPDPSATTYTAAIKQFAPSSWTCEMTSVGINGIESARSASVNFTVEAPAPAVPATFSVR